MRVPFVVLPALLLVLPLVHAGDQSDPEITDGSFPTDAALMLLRGDTTLGAPEIDIQAVWFTANETDLSITWQVANGTHRLQQDEALGYSAAFDCGARSEIVLVDSNPEFGDSGDLAGTGNVVNVSFDGDFVHASVGKAYLPCTTLTHTQASSILALKNGPHSWSGQGPVWWRDVAPAQGYGRDFAFG